MKRLLISLLLVLTGFVLAQQQSWDMEWLACENVTAYLNRVDGPAWEYTLEGAAFIQNDDQWRAITLMFLTGRGALVETQDRYLFEIDGGSLFLFIFENKEGVVVYEQAEFLVGWPVVTCIFSVFTVKEIE